MNRTTLLTSIVGGILVLSAALHAETGKAPGGAYELKNRSAFRIDADARAPFWAIGWKRPKGTVEEVVAADAPKVRLQPSHFTVTSILGGNPPLAMINGHSFEEGEVLPVVSGTERLRVVVRAIRDGEVVLEYEGQQIVVPIHRPELGVRRAAQKAQAPEFTIRITPQK